MRAEMQVGQAVLDKKLGRGGMAEVWLGHNAVLGTPVAVKFLIPPWAGHPDLERRFLNEAKRQGAVDHPNIVKVYAFEYVEDHSFLIMQYVDGGSLDDKMIRGGRKPLDYREALKIAIGTLEGLEYAHNHQIVHRDVKPSNIMLDRNLHPYIGDFGLALVRDEQRVTRTGTVMGTPFYMSPEQILRPKEVDHRTDIYSFGCVLYEMFAGRTPFETEEDGTDFNVRMAHTGMAPPPLRQWNPAIPTDVEAAVMKCLEKKPNDRFSTCGELREVLVKSMAPLVETPAAIVPVPAPAAPSLDDFRKLFDEPLTPQPLAPQPLAPPPPPPSWDRQRATSSPIPPPPPPPPLQQRRNALPMPLIPLIALGAVLIASLGAGAYYVTKHYSSVQPKQEQQASQAQSDLQAQQSQPQSDLSQQPMPQPESKVGTIPNAKQEPPPPQTGPESQQQQPQQQQPLQQQPLQQQAPQQQTSPQQQPQVQEEPQPRQQVAHQAQLESAPLNDIKFRVKLKSEISSETSEEGQVITAAVLAPASCGGCTLIGLVNKAGRSGSIFRRGRAELLFNFHTVKFPDGQLRAIDSRVVTFKNSKGDLDQDEEGQKVDAANSAKKIFIASAAGTVIGGMMGQSQQGSEKGKKVAVALFGFTAKGKVMSFAPGSVFELKVSDHVDQSQ